MVYFEVLYYLQLLQPAACVYVLTCVSMCMHVLFILLDEYLLVCVYACIITSSKYLCDTIHVGIMLVGL